MTGNDPGIGFLHDRIEECEELSAISRICSLLRDSVWMQQR